MPLGLLLTVGVIVIGSSSQELSPPVILVFDGRISTPEYRIDRLLFLQEFLPEPYRRVIDEGLIERLSRVYQSFDDPKGFEPEGGMAYCLDTAGRFTKLRFRTVADKETFEKFLDASAARRGSTVMVTREADRVVMKDTGPGETRPSGAVVRWSDAYFAYGNGVVAFGDASAWNAPFSAIRRMARKGEGHDWVLYGAPASVPDQYRDAFLAEVRRHAGVTMQPRDEEHPDDYSLRRASGESLLKLIRQSFGSVTEFVVWTDQPNARRGFRCHAEALIDSESALAKDLRALRRPDFTSARGQGEAIVRIQINAGIPSVLQQPLSWMVQNTPDLPPIFTELLLRITQSPAIAGEATLTAAVGGEPVLQAFVDCEIDEDEWRAIVDSLSAVGSSNGVATVRLPSKVWGVAVDDYQIGLKSTGSRIELSACRSIVSLVDRGPDAPAESNPPQSVSDAPLMRVQGDLGVLGSFDADTAVEQLIVTLEEVYQQSMGSRYPHFLRRRGAAALDEFVSMSDGIHSEGDWSFLLELRVSRSGDRITFDCQVGRELYGLLLARRAVTETAVFRQYQEQ